MLVYSTYARGAHGVMVIVVGNSHDDISYIYSFLPPGMIWHKVFFSEV